MLELERHAPGWLLRMSTPGGIADFQRRHGLPLPPVLRQYYQSLRLICLLQAAWNELNTDVFLEDLDGEDLPAVRIWRDTPHIVIGCFPYCGTECGAELIGNDQYMYWEGACEDVQPHVKLADWLHGLALKLLVDA